MPRDASAKSTGALRYRADATRTATQVKDGDRLAEWDPFTLPIITEQSGVVRFQDLIDGTTMEERVDDATGIAQRVVTELRASSRKKKDDLRPRLTLLGEEGDKKGEETEAAALHAGAGHFAVGRGRPDGRSGRHSCPCKPRSRQDPRHHRRSAASRRTVRGAYAEGRFGDRQDFRPGRIRPRVQGQAQDRDRARGGRSGGIPDRQDQGDRRSGRRPRQEGRHAGFGLARTRTTFWK